MSEAVTGSVFDVANLIDPYPLYKALRDEEPVHFEPAMNVHVVTRYDLVREVIRDTAVYSSRFDEFLGASQVLAFQSATPEAQQKLTALAGEMIEIPPTMLTLDEPEHTKYRSLVNQLFTAGQIRQAQDSVQAVIDKTVESLVADNAKQGVCEFIKGFADNNFLTSLPHGK